MTYRLADQIYTAGCVVAASIYSGQTVQRIFQEPQALHEEATQAAVARSVDALENVVEPATAVDLVAATPAHAAAIGVPGAVGGAAYARSAIALQPSFFACSNPGAIVGGTDIHSHPALAANPTESRQAAKSRCQPFATASPGRADPA